MIIAGIDEAGLGPALGPLCVCASVFEVTGKSIEGSDNTCLWSHYNALSTRKKADKSGKMLITDSKIAYASGNLEALEFPALSYLLAGKIFHDHDFSFPHNLHELLKISSDEKNLLKISTAPWFTGLREEKALQTIEENKLISCAKDIGNSPTVDCHSVEALILTAKMLNDLLARGLNKSEAVMLQTGTLIRKIYEKYQNREKIIITVDKQGGRNFYAPFLMDTLNGAWVTPIVESADLSEYTAGNLHIFFRPKADSSSFAVALSSLYAKYLRERMMEVFNNFFRLHLPDLEPTAGYHGDAPRFFTAIEPVMKKLSLNKDSIWRNK